MNKKSSSPKLKLYSLEKVSLNVERRVYLSSSMHYRVFTSPAKATSAIRNSKVISFPYIETFYVLNAVDANPKTLDSRMIESNERRFYFNDQWLSEKEIAKKLPMLKDSRGVEDIVKVFEEK